MKPILFASTRPLYRAENILAIYDAWPGLKDFVRLQPEEDFKYTVNSGRYDILVTDEFVRYSPGKVVMIFHGATGGKTYGMDQPHPYASLSHMKVLDYLILSTDCKDAIDMTIKQCGHVIDRSHILPLGMPRTDNYFKPYQKKESKKVYLYAPTYRPYPLRIRWSYLNSLLSDNEILIVKPHMLTKDFGLPKYPHIQVMSSKEPSTDILKECDVLITDFSTIMFDGYLLGKPVLLFASDKDQYLKERGMYYPYPEAYGNRFCGDDRYLIQEIRKAYSDPKIDENRRIIEHFTNACDGHATERLVELLRHIQDS